MGGRYKNKAVTVRTLKTGIRIYLYDSRSIYVEDKNGCFYVFHRWGETRLGFYTENWKPFSTRIRNYKTLDLSRIYQLANRFDISAQRMSRTLDLDSRPCVYKN